MIKTKRLRPNSHSVVLEFKHSLSLNKGTTALAPPILRNDIAKVTEAGNPFLADINSSEHVWVTDGGLERIAV